MNTEKANTRGIESTGNGKAVGSSREFEQLLLNAFSETRIQLFELSEKMVKSCWFLGGIITRDSYAVAREWKDAERDRLCQLAELRDLSRELHRQIGAVAEVKFELWNAIERLKTSTGDGGLRQLKTVEQRNRDIDDWVPAAGDDEQNDEPAAGDKANRSADTDAGKPRAIRKLRD